MHKKPDFIAELKFRTTEQGGRETPAKSGYRPQIKFDFTQMLTSGNQIFIGTDLVYPGETVLAEITVASPQIAENRLKIGTEFEFREGKIIIGIGKITEILNKSLEKK